MTIPLSALWLDADAVGRMLSLSGRVVRRMKARQREVQEAAKAREDERAAKVRPIAGRQRRAGT